MRWLLSILFKVAPKMSYDLIRKHLSNSVPFARHAGVEIDSIGKGRATAHLPFRPEGLNSHRHPACRRAVRTGRGRVGSGDGRRICADPA